MRPEKSTFIFSPRHMSASRGAPTTHGTRIQQNRQHERENRRFLLAEEFAKMLLWISWD